MTPSLTPEEQTFKSYNGWLTEDLNLVTPGLAQGGGKVSPGKGIMGKCTYGLVKLPTPFPTQQPEYKQRGLYLLGRRLDDSSLEKLSSLRKKEFQLLTCDSNL